MELFEILCTLTEPRGPSGHEGAVTERAGALLSPYADKLETDRMGNLFGWVRCGKRDAKTVMLMAHLDEIGFMVTHEENGFASFRPIGSIDSRLWHGAELLILTDPPRKAVVATLPPHLQKQGKDPESKAADLFLDTGGVTVPPGSVGVFAGKTVGLGDCVSGCALDNRAGFAALLWMLKNLKRENLSCDIIVCGSVQEEIGTRGAAVAAFGRHPDYAVAVDVTYGESPQSKEDTFPLGGGVCINRGPDCHRGLTESLIVLAREKDIPFQIEVTCGMSRTDATPLQTSAHGIATAVLSIPLRYMHTPTETLCLRDIEAVSRLLEEWVTGFC